MKVKKELLALADKKHAKNLARFFKTRKGEYGEGDIFLGITVPVQRIIAEKYFRETSVDDIERLLRDSFHEVRLTALMMLVLRYRKGIKEEKEKIYRFYLKHTAKINNWDLVDLSAHKIVGDWLADKNKLPLYLLAKSRNLWERRIAIISTFAFIRKNNLDDTFTLAKILLKDKEDLMHKAVGWALRECGKKNKARLKEFIERYGSCMPRTTLRYAIEKFPETERKKLLQKTAKNKKA
ncbi:MAG: DNA alkylation repair protein [Parcubacteria group bacterium]